jgi:hypothetical protein
LGQVLRIWGGSYHDYWFTDDAVLKVRLVPQTFTIIGIVVLVALTAFLGITGVLLGALIAALIYFASKRIAMSRRARTASLSVQDVRRRGMVTLRIPYSVVSHAEIEGNRLTLSIDGRKVRVNVPEEDLQRLESLLQTKLPSNFSTSTA